MPLWAHRSAVSLPSCIEFNCLRSAKRQGHWSIGMTMLVAWSSLSGKWYCAVVQISSSKRQRDERQARSESNIPINAFHTGVSVHKYLSFTILSKISWATWRTTESTLSLFVLIWMQFSCWIQIWHWAFEFVKVLKKLKLFRWFSAKCYWRKRK